MLPSGTLRGIDIVKNKDRGTRSAVALWEFSESASVFFASLEECSQA